MTNKGQKAYRVERTGRDGLLLEPGSEGFELVRTHARDEVHAYQKAVKQMSVTKIGDVFSIFRGDVQVGGYIVLAVPTGAQS